MNPTTSNVYDFHQMSQIQQQYILLEQELNRARTECDDLRRENLLLHRKLDDIYSAVFGAELA